MRMPWRRRQAGRSRRLLDLAGVEPGSAKDINGPDVCRQIAFRAARKDCGTTAEVLAVIEELLEDEAEYEFVVTLLENLQNVVSHGLDAFRSPDEMRLLLGPRSTICWDSLTSFWAAVAAWRIATGASLESSATLLSAQNEDLRTLLWTVNRTLSTGEKLGIADAVRYEKAAGSPIPGFSHIAVALRITGQSGL
ncbi:hypothetical protein AB0I22_32665, partial [Streptomyces sp. NPDC050610]|uniref:hypothetical protein n=1 Tax=Streptomyces sp. NPDC050610 TaxID=3157097 RepID=UPI0034253A82